MLSPILLPPPLGLSMANIEPVLKMVPPPDFSRVLGTSVWDHPPLVWTRVLDHSIHFLKTCPLRISVSQAEESTWNELLNVGMSESHF